MGLMPDSHIHVTAQDGSPDAEAAIAIAETMQALATPSRVRLLYALRDGELNVGELAEVAGVAPAAASQQLRILRHLRLVVSTREGHSIRYRLYDEHRRHPARRGSESRRTLDEGVGGAGATSALIAGSPLTGVAMCQEQRLARYVRSTGEPRAQTMLGAPRRIQPPCLAPSQTVSGIHAEGGTQISPRALCFRSFLAL